MANTEFSLSGDKELLAQFRRMEKAARGKVLLRALISGALLIVNQAKRNAPYQTGNLRRSIHVGGEGAAGGLEGDTTGSDIGGQRVGKDYAEVSVGTNVEYAAPQEFGTRHMAAQPYLRPAVESEKGAVEKEIAGAMRALLRKAVR